MHGVSVVKTTLCRVRDGPALAHIWISPRIDLCPQWEQELPTSLYTLKHAKLGANHMFGYWGSLEKCPVWLLLPSPQIHLHQLLIAYPFIDLVALYLQAKTFAGYQQESPSPAASSPWNVMAFRAGLPPVAGWEACEPMHVFGAGPLTCEYLLISMAWFFQ